MVDFVDVWASAPDDYWAITRGPMAFHYDGTRWDFSSFGFGFQLTSKAMKRAGLDYWDSVDVSRHINVDAFLETEKPARMFFFSTSGPKNYTDESFQPGDYLVFGSEGKGLSLDLLEQYPEQILNIPMQLDHVRSLNLSNCASIVLYEALRQLNSH